MAFGAIPLGGSNRIHVGTAPKPGPIRVLMPNVKGVWVKEAGSDFNAETGEVSYHFVQCGAPWHPRKRRTRSMKGK